MRAALLRRPGTIAIDEIPEPEMGPDDVLIAIGGVGLCGSDLSVFSGRWAAPSYPWVMGHEAFGVIEAVGADVPAQRIGETVVVEPNVACLSCDACRRGWTSACARRASVGMNRQGALAERLAVPSRFAWSIAGAPADLVCAEPATVVEAALRRLGSPLPPRVLVVGVGAQGLLMVIAIIDRSSEVHVHDINADRLAFAVGLGAHPLESDAPDARFPLVVDTVGSPASMSVAVERAQAGGTVLILGLDSQPLQLTAQTLVRQQLVIRGSLTYDHPLDFATTVAAINARRISPGRIITDTYSFEEADLAFERSGTAAGKTWIRFDRTVAP